MKFRKWSTSKTDTSFLATCTCQLYIMLQSTVETISGCFRICTGEIRVNLIKTPTILFIFKLRKTRCDRNYIFFLLLYAYFYKGLNNVTIHEWFMYQHSGFVFNGIIKTDGYIQIFKNMAIQKKSVGNDTFSNQCCLNPLL